MPGRHHPSGAVQRRAEVVAALRFDLAGRQTHPDGQGQPALGVDGGVDRCLRTLERGAHAVSGVLEDLAPVSLDGGPEHVIVGRQRRPHAVGIGFPPARRPLDVREEEGDRARR